jgi:hypothetical protein
VTIGVKCPTPCEKSINGNNPKRFFDFSHSFLKEGEGGTILGITIEKEGVS